MYIRQHECRYKYICVRPISANNISKHILISDMKSSPTIKSKQFMLGKGEFHSEPNDHVHVDVHVSHSLSSPCLFSTWWLG